MKILWFDLFCCCVCVQPFCCFTTLQKSVCSDPCSIKAVIRNINHTVNNDNRDSGILCFLKNCIPSGFSYRSKKNIINLLLDEVTDCSQLVLLFLLCIVKDQLISVLLRECGFHGLSICCTPVRFCANL